MLKKVCFSKHRNEKTCRPQIMLMRPSRRGQQCIYIQMDMYKICDIWNQITLMWCFYHSSIFPTPKLSNFYNKLCSTSRPCPYTIIKLQYNSIPIWLHIRYQFVFLVPSMPEGTSLVHYSGTHINWAIIIIMYHQGEEMQYHGGIHLLYSQENITHFLH